MRTASAALGCLILALGSGCSRCGGVRGVGSDPAVADALPRAVADGATSREPTRLPKHDWNGLSVMMREAEVRDALEQVGFRIVPSRTESFPVLDPAQRTLTLVPIQGYTPPIVAMETEKEASPLSSVYGVRLYFHRNRLYSFQPVYYADSVDLIEPGDEAVPPATMRARLEETFGEPAWMARGRVIGPHGEDESRQDMIAWADRDLIVLYREPEVEGPPEYALQFFSTRGTRLVAELIKRLSGKGGNQER